MLTGAGSSWRLQGRMCSLDPPASKTIHSLSATNLLVCLGPPGEPRVISPSQDPPSHLQCSFDLCGNIFTWAGDWCVDLWGGHSSAATPGSSQTWGGVVRKGSSSETGPRPLMMQQDFSKCLSSGNLPFFGTRAWRRRGCRIAPGWRYP